MAFHVPENNRVTHGPMATDASWGNNGAFVFDNPYHDPADPAVDPKGSRLRAIASDGSDEQCDPYHAESEDRHLHGWEHVSVSLVHRCPTWEEMEWVCRQFWGEEDCVMQLHPPRSQWVNNYPYCLHLWRPTHKHIPQPPSMLVGVKGLNAQEARAIAVRMGKRIG